MTEPLIEQVKNGTCPFTGKRYDCARCDLDPESIPIPAAEPGFREMHMCFCIERFATGQTTKGEMRRIASGFVTDDGKHPTPTALMDYFRTLYSCGVKVIPMCHCDRFCFKHGCKGMTKKGDGND